MKGSRFYCGFLDSCDCRRGCEADESDESWLYACEDESEFLSKLIKRFGNDGNVSKHIITN